MDKAKETINKLTGHHGHHTTDVTEHYKPAVTHEHVTQTREHENTTVLDKETHQDHYHTTVLPVKDQEVLATEHTHKVAEAQHSEHHHGHHKGVHDKVAAEAATFKDRTETGPVEVTHTDAPSIASEHHHHHVHETIQPVIQKQTIQPSVVHTTVPIHEVHHNEPKHYTASALPAVSLDDFKKQGGSVTGLADRVERFEGEPDTISRQGAHGTHSTETGATTGITATGIDSNTSNARQVTDPRIDGPTHTGTGTTGTGIGATSGNVTDNTVRDSSVSGTSSTTSGKPSLLQKLNPFKDSDGDGKKGIMS